MRVGTRIQSSVLPIGTFIMSATVWLTGVAILGTWYIITAIHRPCVGVITEGIKPLYTERRIKTTGTLQAVEFSNSLKHGGRLMYSQTIATTMRLTVIDFKTTHIHGHRCAGIAI